MAAQFFTGTIIQNFLISLGADSAQVGVYVTVVNSVNIAATLLFSGSSDRSKDVKTAISRFYILIGLTYPGLAALCLASGIGIKYSFIIVLILGACNSLFVQLRTMSDYKTPYLIFDRDHYRKILPLDGIISGSACILTSLLLTFILRKIPYFAAMPAAFLIAAGFIFASSVLNKRLRIQNAFPTPEKKASVIDVIRSPKFTAFIAPNFVRGLARGVFDLTAVFGLYERILNSSTSVILVTCANAASMLACFSYSLGAKKLNNRFFVLTGTLLMSLMPALPFLPTSGFIALYFVCYLGATLVDYSIPLIVYDFVPYEIASTYNAWRMMLTTLGNSLAALAAGRLTGHAPTPLIYAVAAAFQLFCGLWYGFYRERKS